MTGTSSLSGRPQAVLVTGCSSGIGRAVALYLARRGVVVFATVRKEADAAELRGLGIPALVPICPLDLTRLEQIPRVRAEVEAELERRRIPGLAAIVNNAGGGSIAPIELMELSGLQGELSARILGPVALLQAFLPSIRRASGRIIWITTPGLLPIPYVSSIHACDFAVNCLARTLRLELAPWRIPSVMIRCGGVQTPSPERTAREATTAMREWSEEARGLYGEAMTTELESLSGFDRKRSDPDLVAAAVYRALTAPRPRSRYQVGHMSRAAQLAELLPQAMIDWFMGHRR